MAGGNEGIYTSRLNFFGNGNTAFDPLNPRQFTVTPPLLWWWKRGRIFRGW